MFVERLRLPLPSNVFVRSGVHWLIGNRRLVLPTNTYCPLGAPPEPVIVNVAPFTLMLPNFAGKAGVPTTRLRLPPEIWRTTGWLA